MPRTRRHSSPVVSRRPDPEAWRQPLLLADGDPRRLRLMPDGTVLVANGGNRA